MMTCPVHGDTAVCPCQLSGVSFTAIPLDVVADGSGVTR